MFDNFSNFSFKKFPIWCFKIDLSNLCALQCLQFYKRRCFKVPGPTALYIVHIQYIPCIQIENWFRTVLYCKIKLIISIEIVCNSQSTDAIEFTGISMERYSFQQRTRKENKKKLWNQRRCFFNARLACVDFIGNTNRAIFWFFLYIFLYF